MLSFGKGKVVHVDINLQCGRLEAENGRIIYFEFEDGHFVIQGTHEPELSKTLADGKPRKIRTPKLGERLIFTEDLAAKRRYAQAWAYESRWHIAKRLIAHKPIYAQVFEPTPLIRARQVLSSL